MASGFPDWLRAFQMLGKYGDVFTTVAVTEAGNLYVLLQGEDADEVLQTVRLDDEGRLSAFIIDSSDAWGRMLSIGNAELAARLGSVRTHDRRGGTYYTTSFEHGLADWGKTELGGGSSVRLSPLEYRTGGYSVRCRTGAVTPAEAGIRIKLPLLAPGGIGAACAWRSPEGVERFYTRMFWYSEDTALEASLEYCQEGGVLKIGLIAGGWHILAEGLTLYPGTVPWHIMKLVVDFDTGYYVRAIVDRYEWDISAWPCVTVALLQRNTIAIDFVASNIVAVSRDTYIDDVVLTAGEP